MCNLIQNWEDCQQIVEEAYKYEKVIKDNKKQII